MKKMLFCLSFVMFCLHASEFRGQVPDEDQYVIVECCGSRYPGKHYIKIERKETLKVVSGALVASYLFDWGISIGCSYLPPLAYYLVLSKSVMTTVMLCTLCLSADCFQYCTPCKMCAQCIRHREEIKEVV